MAITSSDIDNQSFSVDRKGYSIEEVDVFLEKVSHEVGVLNEQVKTLEQKQAEVGNAEDSAKVKELNDTIELQKVEIEKLKKEIEAKTNDGKVISEALIVAQRSAEKIVAEANDKAAKIVKDANDKSDYIEKEADTQKKKVLAEIDKLEKEQLSTRKQYQVMLRDIIASMDKALGESEGLTVKKSPASTGKVKASTAAKTGPVKVNNEAPKKEAKPVEVKPEPEKDFSGFGDTDFGEDKID